MAGKRDKPEEIVVKLRQLEVVVRQKMPRVNARQGGVGAVLVSVQGSRNQDNAIQVDEQFLQALDRAKQLGFKELNIKKMISN